MKKLALVMLLLLTAVAQPQDLPKFKKPLPATPQVLKMGYAGLTQWADKNAASAMNEMEQDNLAGWYAQVRQKATSLC